MKDENITYESTLEKVKKYLDKNYYRFNKDTERYEYQLYSDYVEELSDEQISEICSAEDSRSKYLEIIDEIYFEKEFYEFGELMKELHSEVEEIKYFDSMVEEIRDMVEYGFDYDHYNQEITIDIMMNVGDLNYDFVKNNVLNYCDYYTGGKLTKLSPIHWLSKQQKKLGIVQDYIKNGCDAREVITPREAMMKMYQSCASASSRYFVNANERGEHTMNCTALKDLCLLSDEEILKQKSIQFWSQKYPLKYYRVKGLDDVGDGFAESVIRELKNLPNHMSTLTYCVSMELEQFLELKDAINAEAKYLNKYQPWESKGNGYIIISKDATVGLYNPWNGGGSLLGIKLDNDVKLPLKYVWDAVYDGAKTVPYGYSIHSIYGVSDSMWTGEVTKIKKATDPK